MPPTKKKKPNTPQKQTFMPSTQLYLLPLVWAQSHKYNRTRESI